jgi:protein-tyrosine phosphatase
MKVSLVLPNLYLGPEPRLDEDFAELQAVNVTAILSVQDGEDRPDGGIEAERMAATMRNISFTNVPVRDFDRLQLVRRLPDCVAALVDLIDSGHTVYVHCSAGINRSPTVVVAYLFQQLRWNLDRSLTHVTARRVCVPDAGAIQKVQWDSAAES